MILKWVWAVFEIAWWTGAETTKNSIGPAKQLFLLVRERSNYM